MQGDVHVPQSTQAVGPQGQAKATVPETFVLLEHADAPYARYGAKGNGAGQPRHTASDYSHVDLKQNIERARACTKQQSYRCLQVTL